MAKLGCDVAKSGAAWLSFLQRGLEAAAWLRGCSVAKRVRRV